MGYFSRKAEEAPAQIEALEGLIHSGNHFADAVQDNADVFDDVLKQLNTTIQELTLMVDELYGGAHCLKCGEQILGDTDSLCGKCV